MQSIEISECLYVHAFGMLNVKLRDNVLPNTKRSMIFKSYVPHNVFR